MAADGHRHILAIGGIRAADPDGDSGTGSGVTAAGVFLLLAHAASLTGSARPRICVINTASADDPGGYLRAYDLLGPVAGRLSHLRLFPMPNVADPADLLMSQDLIFVGGGSVANMLAVWRVHGIDQMLVEAWRAGIVLAGVSAGAICWFSGGTTDSFGPQLRPFAGGLGMLPQSYCPHYDSEARRRPLYQSLVAAGELADGFACDDGAAAHVVDDALAEIVTDRPAARGYLVQRRGEASAEETELKVRQLS